MSAIDQLAGFAEPVESLAEAAPLESALARHTAVFARVLVAHPEVPPIPLVHTITAPTAMQNLLPFVAPQVADHVYRRLWQVSAAITALFATPAKPGRETNPDIGEPTLGTDELVARAIEHGDEHTIKLTEACLREDSIGPDPARRIAAEAVLARTPPMA